MSALTIVKHKASIAGIRFELMNEGKELMKSSFPFSAEKKKEKKEEGTQPDLFTDNKLHLPESKYLLEFKLSRRVYFLLSVLIVSLLWKAYSLLILPSSSTVLSRRLPSRGDSMISQTQMDRFQVARGDISSTLPTESIPDELTNSDNESNVLTNFSDSCKEEVLYHYQQHYLSKEEGEKEEEKEGKGNEGRGKHLQGKLPKPSSVAIFLKSMGRAFSDWKRGILAVFLDIVSRLNSVLYTANPIRERALSFNE